MRWECLRRHALLWRRGGVLEFTPLLSRLWLVVTGWPVVWERVEITRCGMRYGISNICVLLPGLRAACMHAPAAVKYSVNRCAPLTLAEGRFLGF